MSKSNFDIFEDFLDSLSSKKIDYSFLDNFLNTKVDKSEKSRLEFLLKEARELGVSTKGFEKKVYNVLFDLYNKR